jgi:hypothetical protein
MASVEVGVFIGSTFWTVLYCLLQPAAINKTDVKTSIFLFINLFLLRLLLLKK